MFQKTFADLPHEFVFSAHILCGSVIVVSLLRVTDFYVRGLLLLENDLFRWVTFTMGYQFAIPVLQTISARNTVQADPTIKGRGNQRVQGTFAEFQTAT